MPIPPKHRGRNGNHWSKPRRRAASSALQGIFGTQLTGGAGSGTGPHRYTDLLQFFETDVVGNPIAKTLEFGKFLCPKRCVANETILRVRGGCTRLAKRYR